MLSELVSRSEHDWVVLTHHYEPAATFPELEGHVLELPNRISVRRSLVPLSRAAARILMARLPLDERDGLLVSSESLGDLAVFRNSRVPLVAYCHTPMKILHDPVARARLWRRSPLKAVASATVGAGFQSVDRIAWRRYCYAFANSRETERRVRASGLVPGGDLEVLHPGVDARRFRPSEVPERATAYFLVAGRIMWQKQIESAIDALGIVGAGTTCELVIAGAVDEKSRGYLEELRTRASGLPVRFEIDVSDDRLVELYQGARGVVFTAPNEDFGIVPLEAMACGQPVIAVDAGGPRETVLHGETGWLVPAEASAIADRMRRLLASSEEDRTAMRRRARAHAEQFDWDHLVARIDEVMARAALERSQNG